MTKVNQNIKNKYKGLTSQSENTLKKLCFFSQSVKQIKWFKGDLKVTFKDSENLAKIMIHIIFFINS